MNQQQSIFKRLFKTLFLPALTLILSFSCTSYKKTIYFQEKTENTKEYYHPFEKNYIIKPGDVLSIDIKTGDDELDDKFTFSGKNNGMASNNMGSPSGSSNQGMLLRMGHAVSDSGVIELPVLGEFRVAGLSLHEIHKMIKLSLSAYIEGAIVNTELITTRFTTIGELPNVGVQYVFESKLNIYEAIALAGDIPLTGKKQMVNIVRRDNNGVKKITLDLTSMSTVESEGYYIANDDIIYVEPYKHSIFKTNVRDITLYSSIITSISSVVLLIFALNK